jgi:hypothetical protein
MPGMVSMRSRNPAVNRQNIFSHPTHSQKAEGNENHHHQPPQAFKIGQTIHRCTEIRGHRGQTDHQSVGTTDEKLGRIFQSANKAFQTANLLGRILGCCRRIGLQFGNQQAPHLVVIEAGHHGVDIFGLQVFRQGSRFAGLFPLALAGLLHQHRVHGKGLGSNHHQTNHGDRQSDFSHGSAPEKLKIMI